MVARAVEPACSCCLLDALVFCGDPMSAPNQVTAIHTLRRQIPNFGDAEYRAHLKDVYGVTSCKQLTFTQAAGLIAELSRMAPKTAVRAKAASAVRVSGQYARALQALWIAAWNLGVVEKRDDRALLAFVERQTGLSHTRFLHDAADAAKAIEGLKGWIARAADLTWPTSRSAIDRKRAVIEAQVAIMRKRLPNFSAATFGALQGYGSKIDAYDEPTLDRLSADIGRMIRRAKESSRRKAA